MTLKIILLIITALASLSAVAYLRRQEHYRASLHRKYLLSITGVVIWGQWAPEGMGKYLYSLLYNGGYMLGEFVLTLAVTGLLLSIPASARLFRRDPVGR